MSRLHTRDQIANRELIDDEEFKVNLDSSEPHEYSRASDINPTDVMFDWMSASVQRRQKGAKKIRAQFLELVEADAKYYGVTSEEIFDLLLEALDEEYANYEWSESA